MISEQSISTLIFAKTLGVHFVAAAAADADVLEACICLSVVTQ